MLARRLRSVVQIVGTTGVGKSQLGIDLAVRFRGEIINSDSMQVYRGLDIITNKHPVDKREGIPHHLLGFLGPDEEYQIGSYESDATTIIERLHARNKLPIAVGGTIYYASALLFKNVLPSTTETLESVPGLSEDVADDKTDPRLELETPELFKELERIDPLMATRWHPNDRRKIRRALQIYYTTGKRQSDLYADQRSQGRIGPENVRYPTLFFWLWSDQTVLDERLDARIHDMIDAGMFEEIRQVHNRSSTLPDFTKGLYQAIGYKENLEYLQTNSEKDRFEGIENMKAATRRYARRQIKLIRNKLLLHCRQAGDSAHIVLLDATDLSKWNENVRDVAFEALEDFLQDPKSFDAAKYSPKDEHLKSLLVAKLDKEFSADPDAWKKSECDMCPGFVANSTEGWQEHLRSNGHKAKVRQAKKRQEFAEWRARQLLLKQPQEAQQDSLEMEAKQGEREEEEEEEQEAVMSRH